MKTLHLLQLATLALFTVCASQVRADLEIHKDYELSKSVTSMTTVKVDSNMADVYLEGLKESWVASNEVAKELGHIADYHIYASELPASGDFNLVLIIEFNSLQDLEPSKARYDAFMKKWGEANEEKNRKLVKSYPDVRTITGEYLLRRVEMK